MHASTATVTTSDSRPGRRLLTHSEIWPEWLARRRSVEVGPLALLFGLCLPIACFALDHGLGFHVYGAWTTPIRVFVGLELLWFAWFTFSAQRSDFLLGATIAAFALGALFAGATGVMLFPSAAAGCLLLIGVLGFVPFGTMTAFGRIASSLASATKNRSGAGRLAGGLTACILLLAPPIAVRRYEIGVAREALAALRERGDAGEARVLLSRLPGCDLQCILFSRGDERTLARSVETWIEWSWHDHLVRFPTRYL